MLRPKPHGAIAVSPLRPRCSKRPSAVNTEIGSSYPCFSHACPVPGRVVPFSLSGVIFQRDLGSPPWAGMSFSTIQSVEGRRRGLTWRLSPGRGVFFVQMNQKASAFSDLLK
jgi:hypothetical protein